MTGVLGRFGPNQGSNAPTRSSQSHDDFAADEAATASDQRGASLDYAMCVQSDYDSTVNRRRCDSEP
jgi:hypothetical protein